MAGVMEAIYLCQKQSNGDDGKLTHDRLHASRLSVDPMSEAVCSTVGASTRCLIGSWLHVSRLSVGPMAGAVCSTAQVAMSLASSPLKA